MAGRVWSSTAWLALGFTAALGQATAEERPSSLRGRLARAVAERLIGNEVPAERMRAYERLATSGSPQAIAGLLRALDAGGSAKTARERLVIIRGLHAHRSDPTVRRVLVRTLTEGIEDRAGPGEESLDGLLRATAAMSLARAGTQDALRALSGALRTVGPAAVAAEAALIAYPPHDLESIVGRRGIATEASVRVLEAIGDQRAFEFLRNVVRRASPPVAARAGLALARLGHFEIVAVARQWENEGDERRWAAARILALAGDSDADILLGKLLVQPSTRTDAIALALEAGGRRSIGALSKLWTAGARDAPALAAALGREGSAESVRVLKSHLLGTDAPHAAYALGRMPAPEAAQALVSALEKGGVARRLAVRAAAVRAVVLDDYIDEAEEVATELLASSQAADRAAAVAWMGAAHPDRLAAFVESNDAAVVNAAMRWLRGSSDDAADAAVTKLLARRGTGHTDALVSVLAVARVRRRVPTELLLRLIEQGSAGAPLAALALAERDEDAIEDDISALLESPSGLVRAQVALGLGLHPGGKALAWLESAYRFETDAAVRHAIVSAAARRPEPARERLLSVAAQLDPEPTVRVAAQLARRGLIAAAEPHARETLWAVVDHAGGASRNLVVRLSTGEALPMQPDPDGLVVAGWLPRGPLDVRVAFGPEGDHAQVRGTP